MSNGTLDRKKKYHFIYKTTCIENGRFYIGMHSASKIDDGYYGSGHLLLISIRKYGKEKHTFEILEFCSSREELAKREAEIVNEGLIKSKDCLNLVLGGGNITPTKGTPAYEKMYGSEIQRARQRKGQLAKQRLAESDPQWAKRVGENISAAQKKRLEEGRNDFATGKIWLGRSHSDETRQKMSDSHRKNSNHVGSKNSQYGTVWMVCRSTGESKKISQEEIEIYLKDGWIRGRKLKQQRDA